MLIKHDKTHQSLLTHHCWKLLSRNSAKYERIWASRKKPNFTRAHIISIVESSAFIYWIYWFCRSAFFHCIGCCFFVSGSDPRLQLLRSPRRFTFRQHRGLPGGCGQGLGSGTSPRRQGSAEGPEEHQRPGGRMSVEFFVQQIGGFSERIPHVNAFNHIHTWAAWAAQTAWSCLWDLCSHFRYFSLVYLKKQGHSLFQV